MDFEAADVGELRFPDGALVVGCTGHRLNRIPADQVPRVSAAVVEACGAIDNAAAELETRPHPFALTSLAEGVDRMAAKAAEALGWRLAAVIPYAVARYAEDFEAEGSRDEFDGLLARSQPQAILDGAALEARYGAHSGYAAAGEALARASHLVLAVWDGEPPRGPGGTADVCFRALVRGASVLWVDAYGRAPVRLLLSGAPTIRAASIVDVLRTRVEIAAAPPQMRLGE
jgi:hypothetical protein